MKLTIELNNRIVTIEEEETDSIVKLITMFKGACKAQGYHTETIERHLQECEND